MAENETGEEQISEDDWAAAMQEQAEVDAAAEAAPATDSGGAGGLWGASSAQPVSFQTFDGGARPGSMNDYELILDIPVQLTVELGRTRISIRNLLQLAHGSVVELDALAGEPMDVLVNGTLIAQGEVVVVNDKFGIRLTDIITPSERVRKLRT